jgi:hypothetical protein
MGGESGFIHTSGKYDHPLLLLVRSETLIQEGSDKCCISETFWTTGTL